MNETFAIGIPTVNQAPLLNETLAKYVQDFPTTRIFIVDNGNQGIFQHPNIEVYKPGKNIGFSASVNVILKKIYDEYHATYGFVINDDIYWGKTEDQVLSIIKDNEDQPLLTTTFKWCNFALPESTFRLVGELDSDNFFNYFSDDDYSYRLKLHNLGHWPTRGLDPVVYLESQSSRKDPSLLHTEFDTSKRNFIAKWGGMPGSEVFKTPFNR